MNWRREIDYHSSRSYGAEDVRAGVFAGAIRWLASATRRKLRDFVRPTPAIRLIDAGQHRFLTLGADRRGAMSGDPAHCPFPIKPEPTDRRDWRVLP